MQKSSSFTERRDAYQDALQAVDSCPTGRGDLPHVLIDRHQNALLAYAKAVPGNAQEAIRLLTDVAQDPNIKPDLDAAMAIATLSIVQYLKTISET